MLTKIVFLLTVGLATVAWCTTALNQSRPSTRHAILDTPTVPPVIIKAEMAHCMPEKQTVKLDLPKEAGVTFFPTCVRVEQCGGYCMHPLLTCKPTKTETVTYQVTKHQYGTERKITITPFYVNVTKHVQCGCQCSVTEQHCTASQTYDERRCACTCNNMKQKRECDERKDKYWDSDSCTCNCRKQLESGAGAYFSSDSCKVHKIVTDAVLEGHPTAPDSSTDSLQGSAPTTWQFAYTPFIYLFVSIYIVM